MSAIVASSALVYWGRFKGVEFSATILAVALALASVTAAISVFPGSDFLKGLLPTLPQNTDYGEILPWLGFMLSGAAGMIWYSYWIQTKGYVEGMDPPDDY